MSPIFKIHCDFWNVGHGLFSSGKIKSTNGEEFVWVYDCGSKNKSHLNSVVIPNMKKKYPKSEIDLLAISHFHEDHISGINTLLGKGTGNKRSIKHILLPYYHPWERLIVAVLAGVDPITYQNEYANYFSKLAQKLQESKTEIETLILATDHLDMDMLENDFKDNFLEDEKLPFNHPFNNIVKWNEVYDKYPFYGYIEFQPYNPPLHLALNLPESAREDLHKLKPIIKSKLKDPDIEINQLFKEVEEFLLKLYKVNNIEKKKIDMNSISMFLYIGHHFAWKSINYINCELDYIEPDKNAILYCGDGSLKKCEYILDIIKKLGTRRWNNIYCLQVPHHGSKHNWRVGLAEYINPHISVFCADSDLNKVLGKCKHPDYDVWNDFSRSKQFLVNKKYSLHLVRIFM